MYKAFLFLLLSYSFLFAQEKNSVQFPATDMGKRVADYFPAFNSGDDKIMGEYFKNNASESSLKQRSIKERLKFYTMLKTDNGTLEPKKILESADDHITVSVKSSTGQWVNLGFIFEQNAPHKLDGIRFEKTDEPVEVENKKVGESGLVGTVEQYLNDLSSKDEFSGAVLIAKNGTPLFQKAYGLANKQYNIENKVDTKFNLGSINKLFTKIAICQLAEQGKLSFDDTLKKFLPDYPNNDAKQKVTINHLLNMRSGIGDFFGDEFDSTPKFRYRTIQDFIPLFANHPLAFEPGTSSQYSNGGFIVLGAIIEKLSGETYYDYVRKHIFLPAGMTNTDSYESDAETPNMAMGYILENGIRKSNIYTRPARGSSAGGGYSTTDDLLKFSLALEQEKLLTPQYTGYILTGGLVEKNSSPREKGGLGIAGGAPGINAALEVNEKSGYTVIVLGNYDPPNAEKVAKQIRTWLPKGNN